METHLNTNQNNKNYTNNNYININNINPELIKPQSINNNQDEIIEDSKSNLIPNNLNNNSNNLQLIRPKFIYELNGAHTSNVNIIRISPNGMYLASGGDDSAIVIWVQKNRPVEFGSSIERITWSNHKILRGHLSDVYDLAWSPDSKYLISGSVDNRALIWSLEKAKVIDRSIDHRHFVQGVSWDPRNKYITTQSSDKSAKIYCNANIKNDVKFYQNYLIKKYSKQNNYLQLMENLANNNNNENNKMDIDEDLFNEEVIILYSFFLFIS